MIDGVFTITPTGRSVSSKIEDKVEIMASLFWLFSLLGKYNIKSMIVADFLIVFLRIFNRAIEDVIV